MSKKEVVMTLDSLYEFFHTDVISALQDLGNREKSVQCPLCKGKVAGIHDLSCSLFPPSNLHRNYVPARYTFLIENSTFELNLMVNLVSTENGNGNIIVLGFITYDQGQEIARNIGKTLETSTKWVVVGYSPTTREGCIYLYKELYEDVKTLTAKGIYK
jgi:hypothetical protein